MKLWHIVSKLNRSDLFFFAKTIGRKFERGKSKIKKKYKTIALKNKVNESGKFVE